MEVRRKSEKEIIQKKLEAISRKNRYQEIISEVTQIVHESLDLQTVLDNSILAMIRNIDKLDMAAIYLVEGEHAVLRAHKGYTEDYIKKAGRIPYPKGVTWKTITEGKSIYMPDVELDQSLGQAGKDMGFKCYLIVPLFIDNEVVGTLSIVSYEINVFDREEVKLLEIVSKQIGIAIRNAKQTQALIESSEELAKSRDQFKQIVETTNIIPWEAEFSSTKYLYVGPQAEDLLGYPLEKWYEEGFWPSVVHPEDFEETKKKCRSATMALENHDLEYRMISKDGKTVWIYETVSVTAKDGKPDYLRGLMIDITERKKSDQLLISEKNILEMISRGKDLSEILTQICLEAENQSHQMLCSFLLVDDTGESLTTCAAPNLPKDYLDELTVVPIGPDIGSCGTASYLRKQVIVSDIENDPLWADFKHLALRNNLMACWSTPILSNEGELFGTFASYYPEKRSPSEYELDIIERSTHLSRIAIERTKSKEALNKNLQRLSRKSRYDEIISTVTRSVHSSLELEQVLENAVDAMHENIEAAENVGIFFVEGDNLANKAYSGYSEKLRKKVNKIPKPKGFTWKTILEGRSLYSNDAENDTVIGPAGKKEGTKSYACMPIKLKDETIGCIAINSFQKNSFDSDELNLLDTVAQQIGVAINNASKAEELKNSKQSLTYNLDQLSKKSRYEETISTITRSVHKSIDLNEVLQYAADSLKNNVDNADNVAIYLTEGDNAVLKSSNGYPKWFTERVAVIPKPKGFTWRTLIGGVPVSVPDVDKDKNIGPAGREVGTKSYTAMPIKHNYATIGCINISSHKLNAFDKDEFKLLEIVAAQIESAINNANQAEALKSSREELRESREHFRLLVETTNVIPWEYDPETDRFTYVGPQAEKLLGYSASEWYEENFWPAHVHQDDKEVIQTCSVATQALEDHELEYRMIAKDGTTVWIYEMVSVISENGKPKTLRGFMIDATERKVSEYEKREAQERYRALIEHSYDIIVETNINGTLLYINPTFNEIMGYEEGELLGHSVFEHIHKDDAPTAVAQFSQAINDFRRGTATYRFMQKSGDYRWVESVGSPFRTATGEVRTVISSRDITERMESEKKLQDAFSEIETLKNKLEKENIYLKKEIELSYSHSDIIGESKAIKSALNKIEQVAATDATVFLTGETGTGKELFANRIHNLSNRKDRAMVKVNCAALPSHLIESELFGHEKGSFTGAISRNIGRFEVADDSTIFLDEISELPLELQSKLLRVLQEGELQRVGSAKTIKVNVRVIAASNNQLSEAVSRGEFREDLFYRLNVFPIEIPPLRERKQDIPDLLWFFISEFEEKMDKSIQNISRKDMENLINYPWPGNIRQLRNVIERSMILSSGPDLKIEVPGIKSDDIAQSEIKELEEVERDHISYILNMTNWRIRGKSGAAEVLGLKPTTLESRIKRLGIKRSH